MKKLSKLLFSLCIVGVLGCGVAAVAGCSDSGDSDGEEGAKGTLHSAVAATCTESGIKQNYYEYEGKYYSDPNCTVEISLESITSAPKGHTYVYTDKGDGLNHGITCSACDLAETTEAHTDENSDGKCDECEASVYVGTYTEKAATCTEGGLSGHYENEALPGKYFSDKLCTREVTAESLATSPTGHTYVYTDKGDGTHGITCENGDLTETTEAHSDENVDLLCDECGAQGHVGTLTSTAATCKTEGLAEHYETTDLPGKYFSDSFCTAEVTAASLKTEKLNHASTGWTYTDMGDNHKVTCAENDLVDYPENHVDEDGDALCDLCDHSSKRVGTHVEEVAATCTSTGVKEHWTYVIDGITCYFLDALCSDSEKVEYSDLIIPVTEHTYDGYVNAGDGTHSKHCSVCDTEVATTETHADSDSDGKCDKCGVGMTFINSLVTGAYVSISGTISHEFTVTKNTTTGEVTVDLDGKTGTLYAKTDSSAAFDYDGVQYTLSKSSSSSYVYVLTYTAKRASTSTTLNLFEKPEEYMDALSDVQGVYTGEVIFKDSTGQYCKATKIVLYSDGALVYTYIPVTSKTGTAKDGAEEVSNIVTASSHITINYNVFDIGRFTFSVLESDVEGSAGSYRVKSIHVVDSTVSEKAVFTLTDETLPTIPADTMLGTSKGNCFTSEDYSYMVYNNGYAFLFNNMQAYAVSGDETNGYMIYLDTVTSGGINYVLKPTLSSGKVTGFTVYKRDGVTQLATLTEATSQPATELQSSTSGSTNTGATTFIKFDSYALYKVTTSGVYTFSSSNLTDSDGYAVTFYIYTDVDFAAGTVSISSSSKIKLASTDSAQVKLEAGSYIAVDSANRNLAFTAKYVSADYEYTSFSGTYSVTGFSGASVYYLKATASTAGEYVVSVSYTGRESGQGIYLKINGTKYGYTYLSLKWSECTAGTVYTATLSANDVVKMVVGCDNKYTSFGSVTIHFETKADYEARISSSSGESENTSGGSSSGSSSGSTSATVSFTESQQGTYTYSITTSGYGVSETYSYTIKLTATGLLYGDGGWNYNDKELTFVSVENGVYTFKDGSSVLTISFNTDGTLSVTDGISYDSQTATATKTA